jgi:hypothetical protein
MEDYEMDKRYVFGALLLIVMMVSAYLIYKSGDLERTFNQEMLNELGHASSSGEILTEEDIKDLPQIVQKYIKYTGALGKEKVRNFRLTFEGEFKTDPKRTGVP